MSKRSKIFRLPLTGTAIAVSQDRHGSATRAVNMNGSGAFETNLSLRVIRGGKFKLTDGRIVSAYDLKSLTPEEMQTKVYIEGTGEVRKVRDYFGHNRLQRLFNALLYRNKTSLDLGSGAVTNVGCLALANDYAWPVTNAPNNLFRFLKYHATGTGATAAAGTDIKLQTASANGGQTPVVGTQVLVSAANLQKYQSVATVSYTGNEAVTEWGFFAYDSTLPATSALSDATGSPFTAGSATTGTVTGTPLTASATTAMGQCMSIFENTGNATPSWGLVTSNSTSVVNVPAWYKVVDGTAGANPANTNTYVIRPIMWDHKVFAAVNVANGDSIQFTYTLTDVSGG